MPSLRDAATAIQPPSTHIALFHRHRRDVVSRIAAFVSAGVAAGDRVYVIASKGRWIDVSAVLEDSAPRFREALDGGRLLWLNAADVLQSIAPDGVFDRQAAVRAFEQLLDGGVRCRVYGEMVTLLIQRGRADSAAALEALGHELARRKNAYILCGYDIEVVTDPLIQARVADLHDDTIDDGGMAARPVGTRRPLVLLVDDVEDARDMYSEYLRYSGFRVVTAANGAEAVRLAHTYAPDIALMDVRMPVVTGPEALRQLRADQRLAGVPILALTAHAFDNERESLLAEGFDDVIAKPCLPDQLVMAIREVLGTVTGR